MLEYLCDYRFDASKAVSIKLDREILPGLVLTPADPQAFMATRREGMGQG
jgi:hypothetical protein